MPEGVTDTQGASAGGGPAGGGTPEGPGGAAAQATGGGGGTAPEGTPENTIEHWRQEAETEKQRRSAMQAEFDSRAAKLKEMADYDELKAKVGRYEELYDTLDKAPDGSVAAEPATAATPPNTASPASAIEWQKWAEQGYDQIHAEQGPLAALKFAQEVQAKGLAELGIPMPARTQPNGQQATASGLTRADVERLLAERDAKRTAEQFASARSYDRQVRELTEQLGPEFLGAECEVDGEKMTREEAVEVYCAQKGASAEAAVMDLFQGHYINTLADKRAQAIVAEQQRLISAGQLPSGPAAFPQAPPPNAALDAEVIAAGGDGTTEKPEWVAPVVAAPRV